MKITINKNKNDLLYNIIDYVSFMCISIGIINLYYHQHIQAGFLLIIYGCIRYLIALRWSKDILNVKGLFILIWCCTLGLGMLRLLGYQRVWSHQFIYLTFTGMLLCMLGIDMGNQLRFLHNKKSAIFSPEEIKLTFNQGKRLYYLVIWATCISIICHIISYLITGIIPLFATSMYAYINVYTKFMVFEVGMLPSAGLAFFCTKKVFLTKLQKIIMYSCICINVLILPILNVNRGVMVAGIMLVAPMVYYFCKNRKRTVLFGTVLCLIAILFISGKRNFSEEYLRGIFLVKTNTIAGKEFELSGMQAFIYGYLTVSHDNFDYNMKILENYSYGGRILAPFNKILRVAKLNELVEHSKLKNITPGLNTHNLMSYLYYDFGKAGIYIGMIIWGFLWGCIESFFKRGGSVISAGVFGGVLICVVLGFFSCWMANFQLWMWWGTLLLFWLIVRRKKYD